MSPSFADPLKTKVFSILVVRPISPNFAWVVVKIVVKIATKNDWSNTQFGTGKRYQRRPAQVKFRRLG